MRAIRSARSGACEVACAIACCGTVGEAVVIPSTVAVEAECADGRWVVRVDVVIECFRRWRGAAVSSSGS